MFRAYRAKRNGHDLMRCLDRGGKKEILIQIGGEMMMLLLLLDVETLKIKVGSWGRSHVKTDGQWA